MKIKKLVIAIVSLIYPLFFLIFFHIDFLYVLFFMAYLLLIPTFIVAYLIMKSKVNVYYVSYLNYFESGIFIFGFYYITYILCGVRPAGAFASSITMSALMDIFTGGLVYLLFLPIGLPLTVYSIVLFYKDMRFKDFVLCSLRPVLLYVSLIFILLY